MGHEPEPALRRLPVDLSEIDDIASEGAESLYDESTRCGYVDTQTGQVHILFRSAFRCIEGDIEEDEIPEWARDDTEVATAIWEDNTGRYEEIDRWDSRREYEVMEAFAERTRNPELRAELFRALNGHRPFRRFKDVLYGWPEAREAWFSFQERTHREWIREWLHDLGIDPIDTSSYHPKPLPESW